MKRFTFHILVLSIIALVGAAWAEKNKEEPQLRLDLDLADGSHIVGTPAIDAVPVQTSYAKIDVPLKEIRTIRIDADHETASVDLQNGDKLKGVISLKPVNLETIFGTVSVGIEHIRALRVLLAGGALPDASRKGLVLYYSFDRDEDGKVTDESGKKNDGDVKGAKWTPRGKFGGALDFNGKNSQVILPEKVLLNTDAGFTVSVWTYSRQDAGDGRIVALKGSTQFTFGIGPNGGYMTYFAFRNMQAMNSRDPRLSLENLREKWRHLVVSYDGGAKDSANSYRLYLDGEQLPVTPANICGSGGNANRLGANDDGSMVFDGLLDDLTIYDHALSADEVKILYDNHQK